MLASKRSQWGPILRSRPMLSSTNIHRLACTQTRSSEVRTHRLCAQGFSSRQLSITASLLPTTAQPNANQLSTSSSPSSAPPQLAGTAPTHRLYILIHHPLPPWLYPSKLTDAHVGVHLEHEHESGPIKLSRDGNFDVKSVSESRVRRAENTAKLLREVQVRVARMGGLVNFVWGAHDDSVAKDLKGDVSKSNGFRITAFVANAAEHGDTTRGDAHGAFNGLACFTDAPSSMRIDFPSISPLSKSQLDEFANTLHNHLSESLPNPISAAQHNDSHDANTEHPTLLSTPFTPGHERLLLVCTHSARDCRCGTTGRDVTEALKEEIRWRTNSGHFGDSKWRVCEVGHVGGHKYAANVLVYPPGDWYGLVVPADVPAFLDELTPSSPNAIAEDRTQRSYPAALTSKYLMSHWRGRMGLDKAAALEMYEKMIAGSVNEATDGSSAKDMEVALKPRPREAVAETR